MSTSLLVVLILFSSSSSSSSSSASRAICLLVQLCFYRRRSSSASSSAFFLNAFQFLASALLFYYSFIHPTVNTRINCIEMRIVRPHATTSHLLLLSPRSSTSCHAYLHYRIEPSELCLFCDLAMAPRPSSVPVGGGGYLDPYGQHAHDSDEYSQCLFRSPSHGNNFIKQLNHGTATNPGTGRFYDPNFPSPAYSSTLSLPSSIPLPPPMPAQFLNDRSSPWSTLQLTDSVREGRSHMHDDLRKSTEQLEQSLHRRAPRSLQYHRESMNCSRN